MFRSKTKASNTLLLLYPLFQYNFYSISISTHFNYYIVCRSHNIKDIVKASKEISYIEVLYIYRYWIQQINIKNLTFSLKSDIGTALLGCPWDDLETKVLNLGQFSIRRDVHIWNSTKFWDENFMRFGRSSRIKASSLESDMSSVVSSLLIISSIISQFLILRVYSCLKHTVAVADENRLFKKWHSTTSKQVKQGKRW